MGIDWSINEIRAAVEDYFVMLDSELRNEPYSKTDHRRRLMSLLSPRSEAAIERKHQNISAVLIELGFPYIAGYKPLRNYQQLLFDEVSNQLLVHDGVIQIVKTQIHDLATVPNIDDILSTLVNPPSRNNSKLYRPLLASEGVNSSKAINYLALEAQNASLGTAGEEFVIRFEIARLLRARKDWLAYKVEHVSHLRGPSIGYDVLSFEESGRERVIEVKTTAYGRETPFFVTRNEVEVSSRSDETYFLYRVFNFRRKPMLFYKQGDLRRTFVLDPVQFLAS